MPPRRKSQRRGRTNPRSQRPMLSLVQSSEIQLAARSDRISLRGKSLFLFPATVALNFEPLLPSSLLVFNSRVNAINGVYSRYRIVKLLFRILSTIPVTTNTLIVGIQDDSGFANDNPTTQADILQLRCSSIVYPTQTIPTEFEFKPFDIQKWYYTTPESNTSDSRFTTQASIYISLGANASVPIEMHYTLEFEGAVDAT